MAFNNSSEPAIDDGFKSKFNEAFLKMHRFHKLQDSINLSSMNPLEMNMNLGVYNYQIIIQAINGLLKECWSKLNNEDKTNAVELKEMVENLLRKKPVHEFPKNQSSNSPIVKINKHNWELLERWIFKYETHVRGLIGKAGYDSPNADEFDMYEL